jgi:hypothetical protein
MTHYDMYFVCKPDHGVFVQLAGVKRILSPVKCKKPVPGGAAGPLAMRSTMRARAVSVDLLEAAEADASGTLELHLRCTSATAVQCSWRLVGGIADQKRYQLQVGGLLRCRWADCILNRSSRPGW